MKIKSYVEKFMKLLSLAFLSFFFMSQTFAIITNPMGSYMDNAGTVIRKDAIFIKVKNNSGASMTSGSVVIWDTAADDGMGVTNTATFGAYPACVTVGTLAASAIGQCQIYGYFSGARFTPSPAGGPGFGNGVAGAPIYTSPSAGVGLALVSPSVASGNHFSYGIFLDAPSSTTNTEIFIRLL